MSAGRPHTRAANGRNQSVGVGSSPRPGRRTVLLHCRPEEKAPEQQIGSRASEGDAHCGSAMGPAVQDKWPHVSRAGGVQAWADAVGWRHKQKFTWMRVAAQCLPRCCCWLRSAAAACRACLPLQCAWMTAALCPSRVCTVAWCASEPTSRPCRRQAHNWHRLSPNRMCQRIWSPLSRQAALAGGKHTLRPLRGW